MEVKVGITIGYAFDFLGFTTLFFSGAFDSKYKSSRSTIEALSNENNLLKKTLHNLQSVRSMTISTDHITGAPNYGTTITDPNSLNQLRQEIAARDAQINELQKQHERDFRYYLLLFDKAPHLGVLFVVIGLAFQWWFSSYGAR